MERVASLVKFVDAAEKTVDDYLEYSWVGAPWPYELPMKGYEYPT